jgi:phosphoglycolate phosphatase
MAYKAVLFDIDGTLLDTLKDIAMSANRALTILGFPQHNIKSYKQFVGDGMEALAERILPENRRDAATVTKLVNIINREYGRHWADTTKPYAGIRDLLQALTARGLKKAVLSNKPDDSAKLTVSRLLPLWHFELVSGVRPDIPAKPDPAGALEIAQRLDVPPEDFLFLGDTSTDMKTAIAAGMYPVGVLWGFRTADELKESGAKLLIKTPIDLLKIL